MNTFRTWLEATTPTITITTQWFELDKAAMQSVLITSHNNKITLAGDITITPHKSPRKESIQTKITNDGNLPDLDTDIMKLLRIAGTLLQEGTTQLSEQQILDAAGGHSLQSSLLLPYLFA